MDTEIDGREVWVVTVGAEQGWRLVGVYSSEGRAEAARAHLRDGRATTAMTNVVRLRIDEELAGWSADREDSPSLE